MPVFLPQEILDQQSEKLEKHPSQIFKDNYLAQVKALPGVRDLFLRLRKSQKMIALASSANGQELDTYKRLAGIEGLVDTNTSSDDAEESKPHPDIFEAALARLAHAEPENVIVIGDSPYDAIAAAKAGLRTIGVLSGGFAEHDLREAGCIAIFQDPADLLRNYNTSPLSEQ